MSQSANIEVMGLRQRAKDYTSEVQNAKPQGLLQRAQQLRSQIENTFGLLARAEQIRRQKSEASQSNADAALSVPASATASNGLQQQLEIYQHLFDVIHDLQTAVNLAAFWDALAYAIVGNLGAESVVIFANKPQASRQYLYSTIRVGLDNIEEDIYSKWSLKKNSGLLHLLHSHNAAVPICEISNSRLHAAEKKMLDEASFQMAAVLGDTEEPYAAVLIGASVLGDPYSNADADFVQLLGQLSAGIHENLRRQYNEQQDTSGNIAGGRADDAEEAASSTLEANTYMQIVHLAKSAASASNITELYELIHIFLQEQLHVISYALVAMMPSQKNYRITYSNELSAKLAQNFKLRPNSKLITDISNFMRLYYISDFRTDPELLRVYGQAELEQMQRYWVLPLIHKNLLIGFISIHSISTLAWTHAKHEIALSMAEIITPCLVNFIFQSEKTLLLSTPIDMLRERIVREIRLLNLQNAYLSLVGLRIVEPLASQIRSSSSMRKITRHLAIEIRHTIQKNLQKNECLIILDENHFAILLTNKNRVRTKQWLQELLAKLPQRTKNNTKLRYKHCQFDINEKIEIDILLTDFLDEMRLKIKAK